MRCRPGALSQSSGLPLLLRRGNLRMGGGEENNLNWAKTLYVNTIKVISGAKTRKICLHRITLYVSSYQGKGLTARKRQRREL